MTPHKRRKAAGAVLVPAMPGWSPAHPARSALGLEVSALTQPEARGAGPSHRQLAVTQSTPRLPWLRPGVRRQWQLGGQVAEHPHSAPAALHSGALEVAVCGIVRGSHPPPLPLRTQPLSHTHSPRSLGFSRSTQQEHRTTTWWLGEASR